MCCGVSAMARFYIRLLCAVVLLMLALCHAQAVGEISVTIEDYSDALPGSNIEVETTLINDIPGMGLGGFNLRIDFDASVLTLLDAIPGLLFDSCDWEYFTYRLSPPGGGKVGIVGIADVNNGPYYPACYFEEAVGTLFTLEFYVTLDTVSAGQSVPVQFYWTDCGDNVFSTPTGDTILLSRYVYDWLNHDPIHANDSFPTYNGAPDVCLEGTSLRMIDYFSGKVIVAEQPSFERGDLNLNGIAYEIADFVLFAHYFLYGLSVFEIDVEAQVATSDVNADGLVLTVRDFVYLYRIIIGDVVPLPKLPSYTVPGDTAVFVLDTSEQTVTIEYSDSLAAAYLVFDGDIIPELANGDMTLDYALTEGQTRLLISPGIGDKVAFGAGLLLTYSGTGTLVYAEVADYHDSEIPTRIEELGGFQPICGDVDCNGAVDIDDAVNIINFIFSGGTEPCADCP